MPMNVQIPTAKPAEKVPSCAAATGMIQMAIINAYILKKLLIPRNSFRKSPLISFPLNHEQHDVLEAGAVQRDIRIFARRRVFVRSQRFITKSRFTVTNDIRRIDPVKGLRPALQNAVFIQHLILVLGKDDPPLVEKGNIVRHFLKVARDVGRK